MSRQSEYSPPFSELVRNVTADLETGEMWEVKLGVVEDDCLDLGEAVATTPCLGLTLTALDPPTKTKRLDPNELVPDWALAQDFAEWDESHEGSEERDRAKAAIVNDALAGAGYSAVHWVIDRDPRYDAWLREQAKPTKPFVIAVHQREGVLLVDYDEHFNRPVFYNEAAEVELLRLTPAAVAGLARWGLKAMTVDALASALHVDRRKAVRVFEEIGEAVYLYDPRYWDRPRGNPEVAEPKAPKPRKETSTARIASFLGDEAKPVAAIAEATGMTDEATRLALKRGPFEPTNDRPTRWRASSS